MFNKGTHNEMMQISLQSFFANNQTLSIIVVIHWYQAIVEKLVSERVRETIKQTWKPQLVDCRDIIFDLVALPLQLLLLQDKDILLASGQVG